MTISLNQIQNVLRSYQKQLRLERIHEDPPGGAGTPHEPEDPVHISLEARKKQVFEQVAVQVRESLISKAPGSTNEEGPEGERP